MEKKVVYRKNGGKRRAGYPLLLLCAVLLFGFSLVNSLWPKRSQLELENRKAAQLPAFSVQALLDGCEQDIFASGAYDRDHARWPDSGHNDGQTDLSDFRTYVAGRFREMDSHIQGLLGK